MAEEVQRQYWDSCMFISFLSKHPLRLDEVKALLEQEKKGLIQIVVSTLVRVEVRPILKTSGANKSQVELVNEMFDSDRLEPWALTPAISAEAQKLGIKHNELSPGDCAHIATAIAAGVEILFTYDGLSIKPAKRSPAKMLYYDGKLGCPPLSKPLAIKPPYVSHGILFDAVQQRESEQPAIVVAVQSPLQAPGNQKAASGGLKKPE